MVVPTHVRTPHDSVGQDALPETYHRTPTIVPSLDITSPQIVPFVSTTEHSLSHPEELRDRPIDAPATLRHCRREGANADQRYALNDEDSRAAVGHHPRTYQTPLPFSIGRWRLFASSPLTASPE